MGGTITVGGVEVPAVDEGGRVPADPMVPPERATDAGDAMYRNVLADPDDDTARLVYADWLQEEVGQDARAAFVRNQVARPDWVLDVPSNNSLRVHPFNKDGTPDTANWVEEWGKEPVTVWRFPYHPTGQYAVRRGFPEAFRCNYYTAVYSSVPEDTRGDRHTPVRMAANLFRFPVTAVHTTGTLPVNHFYTTSRPRRLISGRRPDLYRVYLYTPSQFRAETDREVRRAAWPAELKDFLPPEVRLVLQLRNGKYRVDFTTAEEADTVMAVALAAWLKKEVTGGSR